MTASPELKIALVDAVIFTIAAALCWAGAIDSLPFLTGVAAGAWITVAIRTAQL